MHPDRIVRHTRGWGRGQVASLHDMSQFELPALSPAPLPLAGEGRKPRGHWIRCGVFAPLSRARERGWGRGQVASLHDMSQFELPALSPAPLPPAGEGRKPRGHSIRCGVFAPLSRARERGWGRGQVASLQDMSQFELPALSPAPLPPAGEGRKPRGHWIRCRFFSIRLIPFTGAARQHSAIQTRACLPPVCACHVCVPQASSPHRCRSSPIQPWQLPATRSSRMNGRRCRGRLPRRTTLRRGA